MVSDQDTSKILIGCQDNKLVSFDMPKVAIIKEVYKLVNFLLVYLKLLYRKSPSLLQPFLGKVTLSLVLVLLQEASYCWTQTR